MVGLRIGQIPGLQSTSDWPYLTSYWAVGMGGSAQSSVPVLYGRHPIRRGIAVIRLRQSGNPVSTQDAGRYLARAPQRGEPGRGSCVV